MNENDGWGEVAERASPATNSQPAYFALVFADGESRQALAATRAGRVAIAIERHRRQRGKLPASLTDVASPLPVDPFTGRELLYQRVEDGFVVSSSGPMQASDARARDDRVWPQGVSVCLLRPGR